jgi:AcrR family transcriptional regulator
MNEAKKNIKEQKIIEAAEQVFQKVGFANAKMADIAREAGITKVTLYAYFKSKENLQMALTYKALQLLIAKYYDTISAYKNESGFDSCIALFRLFIEFSEKNFLYSEALLNYFALIRSSDFGESQEKLTESTRESLYFRKLQDIQNLPFKLTVNEIERGMKDGSIRDDIDPMLATLTAWAASLGYIKIISASGKNLKPLFNVDLEKMKKLQMRSVSELIKPTLS